MMAHDYAQPLGDPGKRVGMSDRSTGLHKEFQASLASGETLFHIKSFFQ